LKRASICRLNVCQWLSPLKFDEEVVDEEDVVDKDDEGFKDEEKWFEINCVIRVDIISSILS
jgi:hypothetical protein